MIYAAFLILQTFCLTFVLYFYLNFIQFKNIKMYFPQLSDKSSSITYKQQQVRKIISLLSAIFSEKVTILPFSRIINFSTFEFVFFFCTARFLGAATFCRLLELETRGKLECRIVIIFFYINLNILMWIELCIFIRIFTV